MGLAAALRGGYEHRQVHGLLRSRALHVALIVVLTAIAYSDSFRGGFVSDDVTAVAENPHLRSLAPANLKSIATSFDDANYIPLKVFSLALDQWLWGPTPVGYHATNLALHIACALAIYVLVIRLGETAGVAAIVALLWAVHPVQVESVAWISERKNVLSTLFFLLALLTALRFSDAPRARTYLLLLGLFTCALLSKINTIVLPALMAAHEILVRRRLRTRDLLATVPLLAIGAALAWVNLHGNPSHGANYHGGSFWVTLRTTATVIPRYLSLVFAPWQLSSYYAVPLRASWLEPPVALGATLVLALTCAIAILGRRGRPESFWIVWFGVTLSPMLNLVPFPALMADRYLYIPLVGVLVILVRAVRALGRRVPPIAVAMPALTTAAVLILVWLTHTRVRVWSNEVSLWADWALRTSYISADSPWGPPPRGEQVRLLREALIAHPDRAALHNNLGAIAFEENRPREAVERLARAHALDPKDPAIALNLGRAYLLDNRVPDAVRTLEEATMLEEPSFFAHLNLARAYQRAGEPVRARRELERARAIRPWARL